MGTPNWSNRTLFHGDNLGFLRAMNSESVDLVATDPPFNKNKDFHATPDSLAAGAKFQDRWSWEDDVHPEWLDQIKDDHPALWEVIDAANAVYMRPTKKNLQRPRDEVGSDMGAFLCFMAVRLLEMRRVLKPCGSIYLHCDPTASHYLKAIMDGIFGRSAFRNEIVWHYRRWTGKSKQFQKLHDVVLFYSRSNDYVFNQLYTDYTVGSKERKKQGVLHRFKDGAEPHLVSVGEVDKNGVPENAVWHIPFIAPSAKERVGYPTQKPLALYERMILTSSNEGDIVLDPFAGCATTLVSAEREGRQWIGIDIWDDAKAVVLARMEQERLVLPEAERGDLFTEEIHFTDDPPVRDDDGLPSAPFLRPKVRVFEPSGPKMSRAAMYKHLLSQHGPKCQGCDRKFDDPRYLQLDHNTPRSDGGLNHISNRILLCGPCNNLKSDIYTLKGLRRENKKHGYMADSEGEHPLIREIREERENAPPSLFD